MLEAIDAIEEQWDELATDVGATPFLRPGWFRAWWRAWGTGEPELAQTRREGRLVAVAPLWRSRRTVSSVTNWHTADYGVLAADRSALDRLARTVYTRAQDRVFLWFLDAADPGTARLTAAAEAAGYRCRTRPLERSPYLLIDGDWERYRAGLRTKFVADLRRRRRRLAESGEVTMDLVTGGDDLDAALELGFRIEGSGWKFAAGTAIASAPDTLRFYREVAHWAAARGWLRLLFLRAGTQAVAFKFGIEADGVHYFLRGGYDPAFRRYAPAQLLQEDVLRACFDAGLTRYEFLGVDEPFKLEWTEAARERVELQAFAPTAAGRLDWTARTRVWPVVMHARAAVRR